MAYQQPHGDKDGDLSFVNVKKLGATVRSKRKREKLTLVEVSQRIGVSPATLSRLERQSDEEETIKIVPDLNTITVLAKWLSIPVEEFLEAKPTQLDTPEIVAAHLRADRNLDPESAKKLTTLFRIAYEQFSSPKKDGEE